MQELLELDRHLFYLINTVGQNDFFDFILPLWRNKLTWIPLYLLLAATLVYKLKINGLYLLVALGITIGITDNISSRLIKKTVERERPCRAENLPQPARVLVHCGGGYSFTSNHAANHFSVAFFLIFLTAGVFGKYRWLLFPWAFLVAYAQVYVGVHYPLDVICGAILGTVIAFLTARGFVFLVRKYGGGRDFA